MIRLLANPSEVVQTFEQMRKVTSLLIELSLASHKSKKATTGTPNPFTPHTVVSLGVLDLEMDRVVHNGQGSGMRLRCTL